MRGRARDREMSWRNMRGTERGEQGNEGDRERGDKERGDGEILDGQKEESSGKRETEKEREKRGQRKKIKTERGEGESEREREGKSTEKDSAFLLFHFYSGPPCCK